MDLNLLSVFIGIASGLLGAFSYAIATASKRAAKDQKTSSDIEYLQKEVEEIKGKNVGYDQMVSDVKSMNNSFIEMKKSVDSLINRILNSK